MVDHCRFTKPIPGLEDWAKFDGLFTPKPDEAPDQPKPEPPVQLSFVIEDVEA